jgi:ABC-type multidrug transport system permease subunit
MAQRCNVKTQNNNLPTKRFITYILLLDIGIIGIAAFISFKLGLSLGIILLPLGIMVGGIGLFLGSPDPLDPKNPRNLSFKYYNRPNEALADQVFYNNTHTASKYSFESTIIYAGFAAIVLSILFLILKW